jgi:hypothetical protein
MESAVHELRESFNAAYLNGVDFGFEMNHPQSFVLEHKSRKAGFG